MRDAACSHSVDSDSCFASATSASLRLRFSVQSCLRCFRSSWRRVKNLSHAARKRSHTAFSLPRVTGPIAFHSACSVFIASAVFTQSVESAIDSARTHSASFFFRFSTRSAACCAKKSLHLS